MSTWLTKILLNSRDAAVRRDLSDAVRLHKRVMSLLPDDLGSQARSQGGTLFRVEETRTDTRILIQTGIHPDPDHLAESYGDVAIRDIDSLLDALDKGFAVRYRIAANASKRLGRTADHPGKVVALRGEAAEQWWTDRAERCGLALRTISATSPGDVIGYPVGRRPVRHAVTRFDGFGTVTDPTALRAAVHDGIGRGKSYGCGLLSLAPAGAR